ncbi:MAG: S8 family serine peptidase [Acidobacteria bacterium]|nr:S8 family serine peptidase [Acidobacteriota bacterium]
MSRSGSKTRPDSHRAPPLAIRHNDRVRSREGFRAGAALASCGLFLAVGGLLPAPAGAAVDPLRAKQWALDVIGAPRAWEKATGRGMTIAVVDSGVDLGHEDLEANLASGHDFVEGGEPQDDCGHGTHVAGIAAAVAGNGVGIAGVAPGARIMPVRVLKADSTGECTGNTADVVRGIEWAVDHGARVINLSLADLLKGLGGADSGFSAALDEAWARGAIPVVAAGNDYILSSGYADDHALVVTATTRDDRAARYSSGVGEAMWGIAAPGGVGSLWCDDDDIWSTYLRSEDSCGDQVGYETLAGTSMAAPMVSGAAAVLLSLGLTPRQTVDRLLATAKDLGAAGPDSDYGHGRLDLARAVAGLPRPDRSASPSPSASPRPARSGHAGSAPGVAPSASPPPPAGPPAGPPPGEPSPRTASPGRPSPKAHAPGGPSGPKRGSSAPFILAGLGAVGLAAGVWGRWRTRRPPTT